MEHRLYLYPCLLYLIHWHPVNFLCLQMPSISFYIFKLWKCPVSCVWSIGRHCSYYFLGHISSDWTKMMINKTKIKHRIFIHLFLLLLSENGRFWSMEKENMHLWALQYYDHYCFSNCFFFNHFIFNCDVDSLVVVGLHIEWNVCVCLLGSKTIRLNSSLFVFTNKLLLKNKWKNRAQVICFFKFILCFSSLRNGR